MQRKNQNNSNDITNYLNIGLLDSDGIIFSKDFSQISSLIEVFASDSTFDTLQVQKEYVDLVNRFFVQLVNDKNVRINFYHIRDIDKSNYNNSDYQVNSFSAELNQQFSTIYKNLYKSKFFIEIIQDLPSKNINDFDESKRYVFNNMIDQIVSFFNDEQVGKKSYRLKNYINEKGIECSQVFEFYHKLISGEPKTPKLYRYYDGYVTDSLYGTRVHFSNDIGLSFFSNDQENLKYFKLLEFTDTMLDVITPNTLMDLIACKAKFVIKNSFKFLPKKDALANLTRQEKNLKIAESRSDKAFNEVEDLINKVKEDEQSLGIFSSTIQIFDNNENDLNESVKEIVKRLTIAGLNYRFARVIGTGKFFLGSSVSTFTSLFTFNEDKNQRQYENCTSRMFFAISYYDSVNEGKFNGTPWGKCVTTLASACNTAYHFNYHKEDLSRDEFGSMNIGHTLILGKSGSGKTVLLNLLLSMAQKFSSKQIIESNLLEKKENNLEQLSGNNTSTNLTSTYANSRNDKLNIVFFDKDYGGKLAVLANNGHYYSIKPDENSGLNPFLCDDSDDNIVILLNLIKLMIGVDHFENAIEDSLKTALRIVVKLPIELKRYPITQLLNHIPKQSANVESIKSPLKDWSQNGIFGWVFDNGTVEEKLNLKATNFIGIDGTYFLGNESIRNALSYYILTKINKILDGTKTIIAFDEVWSWLNDDITRNFISDKLRTMRKLNGVAILCTQSPEEILSCEIGSTICQQCETRILLPNREADFKMYSKIGLSDNEFFNGMKQLRNRTALIKKSNYTVIVNFDLSHVGKQYIDLLSANPENIRIVEALQKKHGSQYTQWIRHYEKQKGYI